ncbi:uncharacterized protein [Epargyreus clarus]|uniref:uncharacterized protein n=1 Tax=Epargyreus clarus TaxID=520877 RepID=UPI003C2D9A5D
MAVTRSNWCCGNLRIKCFIIGYMNLIAGVVDIVSHFFIVALVSRGFECDVTRYSLQSINWPWLEPVLLIINLGTHGFYPFPLILRSFNNAHVDYMPIPSQPRCYPGMIHIYQIDVLNFLINVIWLKFVISYVRAVHKKDQESMRMFFGLSVVKLVLQIMYFAYQPDFQNNITVETYWCIKLVDICIASVFLIIINKYIKQLRSEKAQQVVDLPPSYIECLITAAQHKKEDKSVAIIQPSEQKIDVPVSTAGHP